MRGGTGVPLKGLSGVAVGGLGVFVGPGVLVGGGPGLSGVAVGGLGVLVGVGEGAVRVLVGVGEGPSVGMLVGVGVLVDVGTGVLVGVRVGVAVGLRTLKLSVLLGLLGKQLKLGRPRAVRSHPAMTGSSAMGMAHALYSPPGFGVSAKGASLTVTAPEHGLVPVG